MKSEAFDRAFDDGEDVTSQLDISAARRPGLEQRRVPRPPTTPCLLTCVL